MKSAWSPGACRYQGLVSGLCDSHESLPGFTPPPRRPAAQPCPLLGEADKDLEQAPLLAPTSGRPKPVQQPPPHLGSGRKGSLWVPPKAEGCARQRMNLTSSRPNKTLSSYAAFSAFLFKPRGLSLTYPGRAPVVAGAVSHLQVSPATQDGAGGRRSHLALVQGSDMLSSPSCPHQILLSCR